MLAWIARTLLLLGGMIASVFVTKDTSNYTIVNFIAAVFIFMSCVVVIAYEDTIMLWAKGFFKKS